MINRRNFVKLSGASVVATAAGSVEASNAGTAKASAFSSARLLSAAELPTASGPRVLVVGGGWSGLAMAKYLKIANPDFDVVLIERRSMFMSCPLSNLWLADLIGMEMLVHSYNDAARMNGYIYQQATLVDLDRGNHRAFTDIGYIDYQYIVLAPGIDYNYASVGVEDPADIFTMRTQYPAAMISGSEQVSLRNKLHNFKGGLFLLTVPEGNYRCTAAPYERACVIAGYMRKNKIPGKVMLIDPNDEPKIKREGFAAAFEELHGDNLEYLTSTHIEEVNPYDRKVATDLDEIVFADACIYPSIRASRIIEDLGLADPANPQREANIDPLKYNVRGDLHTYVVGDARPMPFSKSGNTANTEAKYVARVIAGREAGKDVEWESPTTSCYSLVNLEPQEAIMISSQYKHDGSGDNWGFASVNVENARSPEMAEMILEWGGIMYADMFGKA
jgi:NADH dehydrogenase FAD-containing subunit